MNNNTRKALEGMLSRFHQESLSSGERLKAALTLFQHLSRRYQDLLERSSKQEKLLRYKTKNPKTPSLPFLYF